MIKPKPAAIFDHCQHCGVITVWQYRVANQDTSAEGGDYRCQDCQCCGQSADDPELLALSHTMLVKQCELGLGYPVAVSEAHEQAVITGHDREEFRRLTLMLLEQRGLPTPESAKATSKRRPWV